MDGLRRSKARWNVLAYQVMMAQTTQTLADTRVFAMDRWDGYVAARQRLMNFFAKAKPSNPIVITGDIHTHWAADLKVDFDEPSSATVGAELVGTSIASGGDGNDDAREDILSRNPHIKFRSNRRGYVRVTLTASVCTADFRVVPYISRTGAPVETRASFAVEAGRPGIHRL